MIIIYTGRGKGKTSACIGQAIRGFGHGLSVIFAQFFKQDGISGEQAILQKLLNGNFRAGGPGFFRREDMRAMHRQHSLELLHWACASNAVMTILDEVLYALNAALLERGELEEAISQLGQGDNILVLSGRDSPDWLIERADIVTEMREVKHWLKTGITARAGIEF